MKVWQSGPTGVDAGPRPRPTQERTLHHPHLLRLSGQPAGNALQVEGVPARPPHDGRVVPGEAAVRGAGVVCGAADAAHIVPGVPRPGRHGVPVPDFDPEHGGVAGGRGRGTWA